MGALRYATLAVAGAMTVMSCSGPESRKPAAPIYTAFEDTEDYDPNVSRLVAEELESSGHRVHVFPATTAGIDSLRVLLDRTSRPVVAMGATGSEKPRVVESAGNIYRDSTLGAERWYYADHAVVRTVVEQLIDDSIRVTTEYDAGTLECNAFLYELLRRERKSAFLHIPDRLRTQSDAVDSLADAVGSIRFEP